MQGAVHGEMKVGVFPAVGSQVECGLSLGMLCRRVGSKVQSCSLMAKDGQSKHLNWSGRVCHE